MVLFQCKTKDNIEPQGFISADVDGKDWFKKKSKQGKRKPNFKPYALVYKANPLDTFFCNSREISITFGVIDKNIPFAEYVNIYLPKAMLLEGNYKVFNSEIDNKNEDCSKKQISSLFSITSEDPPSIRYELNEKKENLLKILKIDRQNKYIEGQFQLNYKLVSPNNEENLDFKNGYFKIYYTIDL